MAPALVFALGVVVPAVDVTVPRQVACRLGLEGVHGPSHGSVRLHGESAHAAQIVLDFDLESVAQRYSGTASTSLPDLLHARGRHGSSRSLGSWTSCKPTTARAFPSGHPAVFTADTLRDTLTFAFRTRRVLRIGRLVCVTSWSPRLSWHLIAPSGCCALS